MAKIKVSAHLDLDAGPSKVSTGGLLPSAFRGRGIIQLRRLFRNESFFHSLLTCHGPPSLPRQLGLSYMAAYFIKVHTHQEGNRELANNTAVTESWKVMPLDVAMMYYQKQGSGPTVPWASGGRAQWESSQSLPPTLASENAMLWVNLFLIPETQRHFLLITVSILFSVNSLSW